jgi:phosphoglycerate dehydrogenase-like enzyme
VNGDDVRNFRLSPMNLLIFLTHPEPTRSGYEKYLAPRHPELTIRTVGSRDEALKHAAWADILMAFGPQVKTDFFRDLPRLKWVHALGTGTDGITDSPHLGKDVIVTATRGIHGPPISELAFLLMLAFSRDFRRIERQRGAKAWERFPGRLLDGKTIGVLGIGAIAEGLGPRCKAFGMRVVGISRTVRPVAGFDKIYSRAEIADAAAELDYFVLLLPLEPDSRNIVDDRVLAAIKPGAYLINLARGGVLDEAALIRALSDGRLAGAALDALATEPLPTTSPLWTMPNVIITPHIGGYYDDYPHDAARQFEQSLAHFVAGRPELMLHREQRG